MKKLHHTRTFWVGVAAVATGLGGYSMGAATWPQASQLIYTGLAAIFLRSGLLKGERHED